MTSVADEKTALSWAYQRLPFSRCTVVRDTPWSRVFRLYGDSGVTVYLKAVSKQQRVEINLTSLLSRLFPQNMPRVLAADENKGLLLLADHGGKTVPKLTHAHRRAVLQCYGRMQARCYEAPNSLPPSLSTIDPSELEHRLHDFLQQDGTNLLNRDMNALAMNTFQKNAEKLASSLAMARRLPTVLEHGDLHGDNISVLADGTPVLLDWSDAVLGPVGMSLGFLFNGCATFVGRRRSKCEEAEVYIDALTRSGVASHRLLLNLHHGAIAGLVHAICQARLLVSADARFERFGGQLVMRGMSDLDKSIQLI